MFESELIKTDITAIKLTDNFILAGVGNFLNIFDKNANFLKKIKIFDGEHIQGIEFDERGRMLLLHGGRCMHSSEFHFGPCKISNICIGKSKDWILTARWLKNDSFAVVVMNNRLLIYHQDLSLLREVICKKKCILYSASIIYDRIKEIVVLSGTVFGEILVWKSVEDDFDDRARVSTKLEGHNGVIFSVCYNQKSGYILSTSDDRSSILWSVDSSCIHQELWKSAPVITLKRKFYGHQSRIFRSLILDDVLITAGEDSVVNVWNFQGELLNKIAAHQGGAVWALDCRKNVVAVGGSSCGISISTIRYDPICQRLTIPNDQVPKRVGLLKDRDLVVVTESGGLYCYRHDKKWIKIEHHETLKNYSLLEVSKCRSLFALAGYHGDVYIYQKQGHSIETLVKFETLQSSRVYSFHWLTCQTFLICEENGILSLWCYLKNRVVLVTTFRLHTEGRKDLWSTTACQTKNGTYVVGDRRGNIYLFELKSALPIQILKKVHNHLGVTRLESFDDRIISFGRDSTLKTFTLKDKKMELFFTDKLPFTWLANLTRDGLLSAFSSNNFVLWNYETKTVLFEQRCGGGHRSWDFHRDEDRVTFVYVKERGINVTICDKKQIIPTNVISDYHINTVNSARVITSFDNDHLLVSGSEDTTLRIFVVGKDNFVSLKNFKAHLSSVKTVLVHPITRNEFLMFSGGGRGQMICWSLIVDEDKREIFCRQKHSHYQETNEKLFESEIRIMDMKSIDSEGGVLLFVACSDGNISVFRVEKKINDYKMIFVENLRHEAKCVTKLHIARRDLLLSMNTEGVLSFWNVEGLTTVQFCVFKVHQSGIVACSSYFIDARRGLVLTGGDDGSVVLNLFEMESDGEAVTDCKRVAEFRDSASHCAQVTGTWITESHFLTTSVDQKLLVFEWSVKEDVLECSFVSRYNSTVADIQGMDCVEDDGYFHVFLYGKGVEYVKIKKNFC